MRNGMALMALLALSSDVVVAADKTDFAAEFRRIEGANRQVLTGRLDRAKMAEVQKKTSADLEALTKKAAVADRKEMSPADMAAVAMAHLRLRGAAEAVKWADFAIQADPKLPSAHETKVRGLIADKKIVEAEKALAEAPAINPQTKASLHFSLSSAFEQRKEWEPAIKHLKPYVTQQLSSAKETPIYAGAVASGVRRLADLYAKAKRPEEGLKELRVYAAAVRQLRSDRSLVLTAITDLQISLANYLREMGKTADADKVLREEASAVETALTGATGELRAGNISRKVKVLAAVAQNADDNAVAKVRTDTMTMLVDEATKHRKDPTVVRACVNGLIGAAGSWVMNDPKASKAAVEKTGALLASLGEDFPAAERTRTQSLLGGLNTRLTAAIAREELVGKPMPAPVVIRTANEKSDEDRVPESLADADWINGSPPALKGKVVLIDFWAVWCGSCILTFPHLREWHEHYAKDGLVIVGATKYYKYGWDDAQMRAVRNVGISKDQERLEAEKFLAHHQLKYPIAFFDHNDFSQAFKVSGIPQAVVIDRKGNVRLIRVGSQPENAKAIEAMIKKCLAEPAN